METNPNGSASRVDMVNYDAVDEEMIEKLWAKERYEMNPEDREATHNELHGVESRYDVSKHENPENHLRALIQFDKELHNPDSGLSTKLKSGYLRAQSLQSSYVLSSDLRLRFLRAELFDVSKAVVRFCNFLNFMLEFYGEVSLLRQLFISDLTKRERKLLKEGSMQLSPTRDSLGRRIMFLLGNVGENYSTRERDRVGVYLIFQVIAEDETTQRNGLVTVHIMSEGVNEAVGGDNSTRLSKFFGSFFKSFPLRFSAVHMCFPNELVYRLLKPIMLWIIGDTGRKFLRIHSGSSIECNYSLSSFGVRSEDVPTTFSGKIKTRQHTRWMKVRIAMDEYVEQQCRDSVNGNFCLFYTSDQHVMKPFPHIQCPETNCVLFHKNGVAWDFPGNITFRAFLDEELELDRQLNGNLKLNTSEGGIAQGKERFLDRILRLCLERDFRFLLYDDTNYWYDELKSPTSLRRYLGFAIRGRQRRKGAKRQRTNDKSDAQKSDNQGISSAAFTNMDGRNSAMNFCNDQNCCDGHKR